MKLEFIRHVKKCMLCNDREVLIISGFDATASAGILLDSYVAKILYCRPYCVLSAPMLQNHHFVEKLSFDENFLQKQLDMIINSPKFVKIGLLYSTKAIDIVANFLEKHKTFAIADIPLVSSSNNILVDDIDSYVENFSKKILPQLKLLTPNIEELQYFKNENEIINLGCDSVLVKGGHSNDEKNCVDILYAKNYYKEFTMPRLEFTENIRGTGCALSTAITCNVASGMNLEDAIFLAKQLIFSGIKNSIKVNDKVRTLKFNVC